MECPFPGDVFNEFGELQGLHLAFNSFSASGPSRSSCVGVCKLVEWPRLLHAGSMERAQTRPECWPVRPPVCRVM